MNTEQTILSYQLLIARLTSLERDNALMQAALDALKPDWRTPTGASGTMSAFEEKPLYGSYITPKSLDGVRVRSSPTTVPTDNLKYILPFGGYRKVEGSIQDYNDPSHRWYILDDEGYVRMDVVTREWHNEPPQPKPVTPVLSGKWPSPLSAYSITNRHGIDHDGYDLAAAHGASIVNPAPAFVTKAFRCERCKPTGDGPQSINVDHLGDGYGTFGILRYTRDVLPMSAQAHAKLYVFILYGHMSEIDVSGNFPIKAGSRIGRVGSTGNSTGPHLHMEARTSDNPTIDFYSAELINPILFFDL